MRRFGSLAFSALLGCGGATADAVPDAAPLDAVRTATEDAAAAVDADAPVVDAERGRDAAAPAPDAASPMESCANRPASVVELTTGDGVKLVGDLHPGPPTGRGAVLLHMIPPSNDRTNYPTQFVHALTERGFTVLNLDRRGAGDSEGSPRDAYSGPNGRLDPKAAWDALLAAGCGVVPERLVVVGASNGTTSALDFAVDPLLPRPAALVFLTGGTYTENQTRVSEHRDVLEGLPIDFVFSAAERSWSAGFIEGAPDTWHFDEYDPGDHGTRMFTARPESNVAVADWLDGVVGRD